MKLLIKSLFYTVGFIIIIPFAFVKVILMWLSPKKKTTGFSYQDDNNEYQGLIDAWEITFGEEIEYDSYPDAIKEKVLASFQDNFAIDDAGYLYMADYSGDEPIWKAVGRDE